MDCRHARPLISASMDGEPSSDVLDDHIDSCAECRSFREDLTSIRRSLRLGPVVAPPDIVGAVLPQIEATERRSTTRTRIGIVAAAAACLALGLLAVGERNDSRDRSQAAVGAEPSILLAWTAEPAPVQFQDRLIGLGNVRRATTADLGLASLSQAFDADGVPVSASSQRTGAVPVEVLGYDPETFPDFVSALHREQLSQLGPDEVILSDTSAELRGGLTPGDTVVFDNGRELTVAALVAESDIAAAEMAVTAPTADDLRRADDNFMLVEPDGDANQLRADVQQEWTALSELPADRLAIESVSGLAYLRDRPGPTPHLVLKEQYGEFTFVPFDADHSVPDPEWVAANVASARVPPLGAIRCQADTLRSLEAAFASIREAGLADLVVPKGAHRCWQPLSDNANIDRSHLWGIAIELEPAAEVEPADPRYQELVALMGEAGFRWGGTTPDDRPFRFEWSPPTE